MRIALLSPALGSGNIGDQFIELAIRRFFRAAEFERFSIRRRLEASEIARLNECDIALLCGTNLWQHKWESALCVDALEKMRIPVVPLGVGSSAQRTSEREVGAETRRMMREIHARCALGSVRDPHSLEVVREAGVENVVLTGCPVLFWSRRRSLPGVAEGPKRRLVLSVRNWLMHRWPDAVDHPVQLGFVRFLLERFAAHEPVVAIHERYDESLVARLGLPPQRVLRSEDAWDYINAYSDREAVVLALRLHAGMFALANGVPAVFVGHDTRTYSFCDLMGLRCIDLFADDARHDAALALMRHLDGDHGALAYAATAYAPLHAAMERFLEANGLARAAAFDGGFAGDGARHESDRTSAIARSGRA